MLQRTTNRNHDAPNNGGRCTTIVPGTEFSRQDETCFSIVRIVIERIIREKQSESPVVLWNNDWF